MAFLTTESREADHELLELHPDGIDVLVAGESFQHAYDLVHGRRVVGAPGLTNADRPAPRDARAADQALIESLDGGESASTITLSRGRSTAIFRGFALSATGIRSRSTPS